MFLPPQPRFRFYHSPEVFLSAARDGVLGRVNDPAAVTHMEQAVARFVDVKHALAMPQGRVGMYMTLAALLKPGQTVVMSPYTLYDVVNMVLCAGGRPVFADVEPDSCNIAAEEVERLIDHRTGAVLVTHLHGLMCDIWSIREICRKRGVPLLEDACQAFGAVSRERFAGTIGDAGFYSFGRAKNINAFFGGMAVTGRDDLAATVRERMRQMPPLDAKVLWKRVAHCLVGGVLTSRLVFPAFTFWLFRHSSMNNVDSVNKQLDTEDNPVRRDKVPAHYERRMTGLQARLVEDQLEEVLENNRKRQEIAEIYFSGLSDVPGVRLPPRRTDGSHIYLSFPIQTPNRLALVKYLMRHGRDCVIQHIRNTAELPCFEEFAAHCPNAARTAQEVVLLPTYPGYLPSEARKNVEVVRRYFRTDYRD